VPVNPYPENQVTMDRAHGQLRTSLDELLPQVNLPKQAHNRGKLQQPWTVLLTGSTGSLGTNILASLQGLPASKLGRIYCLNRSEDAADRQAASLSAHQSLDRSRVAFLRGDFEDVTFGLDPEILAKLLAEVNLIIHCAWPVDFLAPLESFRPHLDRLRDLCRFACSSPHHPPVLFLSSLGIAYASDNFTVPEAVPDDFSTISGGYSQSKYVAERMVQEYADSTSLPAAVLRLGQLAGPVRSAGVWPHREWFPTLLRASKHIGALPASLGHQNVIDWVPLDIASQIIVELADYVLEFNSHDAGRFLLFNIVNPRPVPWSCVLAHLGDVARASTESQHWVKMLRGSLARDASTPGRRLIGFYEKLFEPGRMIYTVHRRNLLAGSRTARGLRPANKEWLLRWLDQWGYRNDGREIQPQRATRPDVQPVQVQMQASGARISGIKAKL